MSKRLEANAALRALAHLHASATIEGDAPGRRVHPLTEWAVLSALVSYSRKAQPVWPSLWELSAVAHCSVRSTQRALKWLTGRGIVTVVVVPPADRFRGARNAYALPVEPTTPVQSAHWRTLDSARRDAWRDKVDPKRRAQKAREATAADMPRGAAVFVSSHVMDEADRCDRLLLMRDGLIIADDTPERIREKTRTDDIESAFLALVVETGDRA